MRAVVQRVLSASVEVGGQGEGAAAVPHLPPAPLPQAPPLWAPTPRALARTQIDGEVVSRIGPGLLCLIGVAAGDEERDAETM